MSVSDPRSELYAADLDSWRDLLSAHTLPRFILVCAAVWLNAVDTLVTATIMPIVGPDLGDLQYFSWASGGFLVGAVVASASSGRISEKLGLRAATCVAALIFGLGCVASASAPTMGIFIGGRVVQGLGSGWLAGFAMVSVALLFPPRHIARVFASTTAVWGVATVVGPLIGGVFAAPALWRWVFWLFGIQTVVFLLAAAWLLRGARDRRGGTGIPWTQLGLVMVAMTALALSSNASSVAGMLVAGTLGATTLASVLVVDRRAKVSLLPRSEARRAVGPGYLLVAGVTASSTAFLAYAPVLLIALTGLTPLEAGYAVGTQAFAWTISGLLVAGAPRGRDAVWIRLGAVCIPIAFVLLAAALGTGSILGTVLGAALMGAGLGLSSSLTNRRILSALPDGEQAIGSAALISTRQAGGAIGAAVAGLAANSAGFTTPTADLHTIAVVVMLAALPFAAIAATGAFAMIRRTS